MRHSRLKAIGSFSPGVALPELKDDHCGLGPLDYFIEWVYLPADDTAYLYSRNYNRPAVFPFHSYTTATLVLLTPSVRGFATRQQFCDTSWVPYNSIQF